MLYPNLDELRPHLQVPAYGTGGPVIPLGRAGPVFDDIEGLHALRTEHGEVVFQSGMELALHAYRGQTECHSPCVPSMARLKPVEAQLLAFCRNAAFEDAIKSHPYVRLCRQAQFLDSPLHIDLQGLVQHYGLATNLLDFTFNFDVACFFATCRWTEDGYVPIGPSPKPGVIYRITPPLIPEPFNSDAFHLVGWQPLHRPEQQRAVGLALTNGTDLNQLPWVQRVQFRHEAEISVRIWESFDRGRDLFPRDAAAELAEKAKRLEAFTDSQVSRAWERLDAWNGIATSEKDRTDLEESANISRTNSEILSWQGLGIDENQAELQEKLMEVLHRVRYRMAAYA